MPANAFEIISLTPKALRADSSGGLVRNLAALTYQTFRQPPWQDDLEPPRLARTCSSIAEWHVNIGG